MILYFTGTGNSRFVAQKLAEVCHDSLVSVNKAMRQRILDPFNADYSYQSDTPFVVVCPTYCWHLPRVLEDFLLDTRFLGSRDLYFFLTCGSGTGRARDHAEDLCHRMGMNFMGLGSVCMPENYICLFRAPKADEAVGIIRASMAATESAGLQIISGRRLSDSNAGRGMTNLGWKLFYKAFVTDRPFRVTDACVGCGTCASLCPTVNIRMKNGRPVWQGNCTQCQACIGVCPVDAIEYGMRAKGKRRYYLFANGRQKFPREKREAQTAPDQPGAGAR